MSYNWFLGKGGTLQGLLTGPCVKFCTHPITVTPRSVWLSLAQSGSGQGGNRSVPKKEREIHGAKFRVVSCLFLVPR